MTSLWHLTRALTKLKQAREILGDIPFFTEWDREEFNPITTLQALDVQIAYIEKLIAEAKAQKAGAE